MSIHFATFRLGGDEDAVGLLANGDVPASDDERWQMLDAARFHIERLLDEHENAQAALRRCRDEGRPFALFLRSFAVEARSQREAGQFFTQFSLSSSAFQERIAAMLKPSGVPLVRLHGGTDGFFSGGEGALILCTNERNWLDVAADLIGAAGLIVFVISHLAPGVLEELRLIRQRGNAQRCIFIVADPARTPVGTHATSTDVAMHLEGFEHVLHAPDAGLESTAMQTLLTQLVSASENPGGTLDHALAAPFSYVEPSFLESNDYRSTQASLWHAMRQLRVLFDDTYWAALKKHGVAFEHFRFPAAWQLAHKLFGLGIVTMDLRASREALRYIELMSYLRNADYALVLPHLAGQFAALARRIWPEGEPDTEAVHAAGPDVLKLPASTQTVIAVFEAAEKQAQRGDLDMPGCLYQAAAILALRATDEESAHRRWIAANICRDWARFQSATQPVWAVTNLTFAACLHRELAQRDGPTYAADLALTLNNLGAACFKTNDYATCESAWTEALALRRAVAAGAERIHENLWTSLTNLALLREQQGRLDHACALYDEAAATTRQMAGEQAATLLSRALALKSQCLTNAGDQTEEADACARAAWEALRSLPPERRAELEAMLGAALSDARVKGGQST